jgi:hypothetical protein
MSQKRTPPAQAAHAASPGLATDGQALSAAADDAVRLAEELLGLHRRLAPVARDNAAVRAARYRLEDAAYTCRRASEEFLLVSATRSQSAPEVAVQPTVLRYQPSTRS